MYEYYFTFLSITKAQRARTFLNEKGITSQLVQAPDSISSAGCGYALRIKQSDGTTAARYLQRNSLQYKRIFRSDLQSLRYQEVFL